MSKIKRDINQQDLKIGNLSFVKSDNYHETQLEVSENSN